MTQEDKDLLLRDLSARLPYGVKCTTKLTCYNDVYLVNGVYEDNIYIDCPIYEEGDDFWMIESIIPFLRSMSSMTEKERKEYDTTFAYYGDCPCYTIKTFDFLNKKHFDYRDLIPMGLAIEAPEEMYKKD